MTLLPVFRISVLGGWIFSLIFLMINICVSRAGDQFKSKVLVRPEYKNRIQKISMFASSFLFSAKIAMAVFLPISFRLPFFIVGLTIHTIAACLYISALLTFIKTPQDRPVTTGIYKLTRNPQQIFSVMIWSATGIMLGTFFFMLIGLIELLVSFPGFIAQEEFCIRRYGGSYLKYMNKTPRYLFRG